MLAASPKGSTRPALSAPARITVPRPARTTPADHPGGDDQLPVRPARKVCGGELVDEASVVEHTDTGGQPCDFAKDMAGEEDGRPVLTGEANEQRPDLHHARRVPTV